MKLSVSVSLYLSCSLFFRLCFPLILGLKVMAESTVAFSEAKGAYATTLLFFELGCSKNRILKCTYLCYFSERRGVV